MSFQKQLDEVERGVAEIINGDIDYTFRRVGRDFEGWPTASTWCWPGCSAATSRRERRGGRRPGSALALEQCGGASSRSRRSALAQEHEANHYARIYNEYVAPCRPEGDRSKASAIPPSRQSCASSRAGCARSGNARPCAFASRLPRTIRAPRSGCGVKVASGLEILCGERADLLRGRRLGLLCHPPASMAISPTPSSGSRPPAGIWYACSTEHGVRAMPRTYRRRGHARCAKRLPVVSLYGNSFDSLSPAEGTLADLDVLVIDLQDVGSAITPTCGPRRSRPRGGACRQGCDRAGSAQSARRQCDRGRRGASRVRIVRGFGFGTGTPWTHARRGGPDGRRGRPAACSPSRSISTRDRSHARLAPRHVFDEVGLPWCCLPNMPTCKPRGLPGHVPHRGTNLSEAAAPRDRSRSWGAFRRRRGVGQGVVFRQPAGRDLSAATFRPTFHKHAGKTCVVCSFT